MTWSQIQRQRLAVEKEILQKYFPAFNWINPTDSDNTQISGVIKTNVGSSYRLKVFVPSDFPNSRPDMIVLEPYPLKGYRGQNMKEHGTSGIMHTLDPNTYGYVQICHYRDWLPNLTLYKVVLKGRIWLEALEAHKRTGKQIDAFLSHM
jgi:hypothetical protein